MAHFIRLYGNQQTMFINPKQIVVIGMCEDHGEIHCTDDSKITVHFGTDMSKDEFMNAIASVTNLYTINEQNSSIG